MASKKRRRNDQAPGWVWMLFGLSIGLAVALFVYLKNGVLDIPRSELPQATLAVERSAAETAGSPPSPAAPTGDTPANPPAEPDFEFYKTLEEMEVVVPENGEPIGNRPAQEYTIQAGSFRTYGEADRRQATLALLAIESHIERAIVENQIWHRVIIGPLSERGDINRVLRSLRNERIDTMAPRPVSN